MTIPSAIRSSMPAFILVTILTTLSGCNNDVPLQNTRNANIAPSVISSTTMQPAKKIQADLSPAMQTVVGDYATEDYAKRAEGYDWVGVMIKANDNESIDISVRARSDIKKPTCSYEGTATLLGQDNAHGIIFKTVANGSVTFLQFKDNKLTIDSEDKYALNTFCSGGATLAGDYEKLSGSLELS